MSIKNHHVFFVFKKALEYLLKNNFAKQSNRNAIYDCYPYDFVDYVAELIKLDFDDFSLGISTLIECISNNKYSEKTFEMFDNCFNSFSSLYFDASNDKKIRADLKEKISFLENKIKDYVKSGKICDAYFNVLILTPNNFTKWEDWDKFSTDYNDYSDKMFLINLYEKYGQYDIQRFLKSIYMLKYEKMMPEILKPMSKILSSFDSRNKQILKKIILENKYTFIQFISESFCNNRISIKNNNELSDCFENILNILISHGVKEAAIILINFQLS